MPAKDLQADAFEQLGYQAEAATWRNFYFVGAQELRRGAPNVAADVGVSPDLLRNLPLDMAFDYLAVRLDSGKAAGKATTINVEVDGSHKRHALVLRNGVLNHLSRTAGSPDATIKGTEPAIVAALMGGALDQAIAQGAIQVQGRAGALIELLAMTTTPEFWFPVVTRPPWG